MSAESITISDLTWVAPDGRRVFSNLNLSFAAERAGLVGRNGVGKTTLLKLIAGELLPARGQIKVTGKLAVLRQIVQVGSNETVADLFGATGGLKLLRRAESGNADTEELADVDWTLDARLAFALGKVGLDTEADTLLNALSGGQRTRAHLAAAIYEKPDFLLLDEPTNNLDRNGREALIDFLSGWRAGAIVVSHDRELLEAMDAIVELTTLGATRYGRNWSFYSEQKAIELAAAQHDLAAEKRVKEVARKTQEIAERKQRRDGAGKSRRAKADMPRILLGGRKNRAESSGGDNARLAELQRSEAQEAVTAARERIEKLEPLTISLPSTNLSAGKIVLEMLNVTVGYEKGKPVIENLSFKIVGPERVAIAGANGSGKTTLLEIVSGQLQPWSGSVRVGTTFAMLDQKVSLLDPSGSIRDNFVRINPESNENACRAALARFKFRADAARRVVSTLSGGQTLLAGLACVLGSAVPPALLILDEPTNHLDLDSIEALENGLNAYDGALLIVSHDEKFLEAIGISRRLEL